MNNPTHTEDRVRVLIIHLYRKFRREFSAVVARAQARHGLGRVWAVGSKRSDALQRQKDKQQRQQEWQDWRRQSAAGLEHRRVLCGGGFGRPGEAVDFVARSG